MPSLATARPLLAEATIDGLYAILRSTLNTNLAIVFKEYEDDPSLRINWEPVTDGQYYDITGIEPQILPTVYVEPAETVADLAKAQNYNLFRTDMVVTVLVEELRLTVLQRKSIRYCRAIWMSLHDAAFEDLYCFCRRVTYGGVYDVGDAGNRSFRKDASVHVTVEQRERFS